MVITFVGSGGKTSSIYSLASFLHSRGKRVLITTTTHMYYPKEHGVCETDHRLLLSRIEKMLNSQGICIAGTPAVPEDALSSDNAPETSSALPVKITSLPESVYEKACTLADFVLVEGDGSKHLPAKFPAAHEPVIPANTDRLLVVFGMSALNRPLMEVCHRAHLAASFLTENDLTEEEKSTSPVTCNDLLTLSRAQKLIKGGYLEPLKEKYPHIPIQVYCCQKNSFYEYAAAAVLEQNLSASLFPSSWFSPQPHLVLLGAGHVSKALYQTARILDYQVTVIDDRPDFSNSQNFPEAVVYTHSFESLSEIIPKEPGCFYAVLTRGHAWDKLCVSTILKECPDYGYLGMIGSRAKVAATFEALIQEGFSKQQLSSIHAPIGLKIGGQTPAEIAISIAAELVQVRNQTCVSSFSEELQQLEKQENLCGILAVIVDKKGSAPRGCGSMMFLSSGGTATGTVGGGNLENHVLKKMRQMLNSLPFDGQIPYRLLTKVFPDKISTKFPEFQNLFHSQNDFLPVSSVEFKTYDVSSSESAELGMICGGQVQIAFLPVSKEMPLS